MAAGRRAWFTGMRNWLKQLHLLRLPVLFFWRVMAGFRVYRSILLSRDPDTVILGTAWMGTGDYYICGCLLPAWLDKNQVQQYVFLSPDKAEKKVLEMFPVLEDHIQTLPDGPQYYHLLLFRAFLGPTRCRFLYLHHQQPFPTNDGLNLSNGDLQGFRGLNMMDFYLASGFCLSEDVTLKPPRFADDAERISEWFTKHDLVPGRTVLLAPYSTGLEEYLPPLSLWEEIADSLRSSGYCVCTNCFGNEQPVKGTIAVSVPFAQVVPFLNMAGGFIGIRSGLCDIISTSSCKKVVLHTYRAKWWPDGKSIVYTGIQTMGLDMFANELECANSDTENLKIQILKLISRNSGA